MACDGWWWFIVNIWKESLRYIQIKSSSYVNTDRSHSSSTFVDIEKLRDQWMIGQKYKTTDDTRSNGKIKYKMAKKVGNDATTSSLIATIFISTIFSCFLPVVLALALATIFTFSVLKQQSLMF